ncbi:MAG: methyltransferase domain-containing protein [Deltaproteobacteria bacterium]|nr:methyltransferase domain-containing protein [Deltaproteobacteria bacterium]
MDGYDPTWWQHIFDETYLVTDARSVCCPLTTAAEVDMVEATLGLNSDDRILDLCGGQGRHAIELDKRGYKNVTVVDYSQVLLRVGLKDAVRKGCSVYFCRGDACELGLADSTFDVVLIMGNSFGYFQDDSQNQKILQEICRLLRSGGTLLLDLVHNDYARQQFRPTSWHEANGDVVVCRQRKLLEEGVLVREMVMSKQSGLIRDVTYFARLFRPEELEVLLAHSGFKQISCGGTLISHPKPDDYGLLSKRMLVTAHKP